VLLECIAAAASAAVRARVNGTCRERVTVRVAHDRCTRVSLTCSVTCFVRVRVTERTGSPSWTWNDSVTVLVTDFVCDE